MRENARAGRRFELSLDGRQVAALVGATLVIMGGVFVLGASYGSRASPAHAPAAAKDPLATLDEPLNAAPRDDASLRAHEALTAARPDVLPSPGAKAAGETPVARAVVAETATPTSTSNPTSNSNANWNPTPTPTELAAKPTPPPVEPKPVATFPSTPRLVSVARTERPEPKPQREPEHARAAHGAYTIQIASTSQRTDAEKVAKRYARRSPRIVAANVPGKGRVWRVQVGAYPTRDAAARGLAALGGSGFVTAAR